MDNNEIVRSLLAKLLKAKGDTRAFTDSELLVTGGRLASMDVLHVVLFLEERYGMDFSDGFDQGEMDSVESITSLIDSQVNAR